MYNRDLIYLLLCLKGEENRNIKNGLSNRLMFYLGKKNNSNIEAIKQGSQKQNPFPQEISTANSDVCVVSMNMPSMCGA